MECHLEQLLGVIVAQLHNVLGKAHQPTQPLEVLWDCTDNSTQTVHVQSRQKHMVPIPWIRWHACRLHAITDSSNKQQFLIKRAVTSNKLHMSHSMPVV